MIAALDVHYNQSHGHAACVAFSSWQDAEAHDTYMVATAAAADYAPGQFFRRELPCLLAVLEASTDNFDVVVIDGYVWLDHAKPGLGWHLCDSLQPRPAVIGVAKSAYAGCRVARAVLRGRSQRPLFVTAIGIDVDAAADHVRSMHGSYRVPTLIKLADQLARSEIEL